MEKNFSIEEALTSGWEILKSNFWFIFSLQVIVLALNFFPQFLSFIAQDFWQLQMMVMAIGVMFFVLQLLANIGMIKIFLDMHDRKDSHDVKDLFSGIQYLANYILASIVYGLIVLGGFLLLIIPGIIWSIKYQFFVYFIIDKKARPMEALRMSAKITEGEKMSLFVFSCAAMLFNLIGFIALGIGLFVTIPLTSLALVHIFRKLSAKADWESLKAQ